MSYESSPFDFDEELDCELHKAWFVDKMHFALTTKRQKTSIMDNVKG